MSQTQSKKFVIIDGNAIVHRAYHALPPLTTKEGVMVNAVYGFTSMLLKVYQDFKPDYLAVSFDVAGGTFRDQLYTGYKAKRVKADQDLYDQIPLVYEVVRSFGIPIYTKEGYEADDVIGTAVTIVKEHSAKNKKQPVQSIIVTGDMDMLQLVEDDVVDAYLLRKGLSDFELYNEAKVEERYGFGPRYVVDYKSLRGDASDNIPGVPGIGEKTAKELIQAVGGIDAIYRQISQPESVLHARFRKSVIEKLERGEESARMSREVATIECRVPGLEFDLEACAVRDLDKEKILPLFQRFEFMSLAKRLPGEAAADKSGSGQTKTRRGHKRALRVIQVNPGNLAALIAGISKAGVFAVQEVVPGDNILTGTLAGLVAVVEDAAYYIDPARLANNEAKRLWPVFENPELELVGHDLKQLVKALRLQGVAVENRLFDVMVASYLLNSGSRAHDMASIALRELARELPPSDQGSLFGSDPSVIAERVRAAFEVKAAYSARLAEQAVEGLFEKIEMALVPVLADMELAGVAIDTRMLGQLSKEAAQTVAQLTAAIWKEAGEEFNVSSSVQLREILYEKMGLKIPGIKKGKTGYSTAASELEKLRDAHPIIGLIEEYREVSKLQNTYIDVLPTLINKNTGRIHTSFNQAVTATGRLSSSDPNLQNIPVRTELGKRIRDAFIAAPGHVLVSADYSQIELRIVASLAEDTRLMEIFSRGEDVHSATAAAINGVPLVQVTKEMRYAAKEVNFGVLYGMGAFGLSWRAGIPQWRAKEFIDKYFEEFAGVKAYIDRTVEFAKKEGYIETLFGRRRYIPELGSSNFQLRSAGERMAVNMPIQGTAADLMKLAMIAVDKKVKTGDVKIILQVHDELVLEVKKGLEASVAEMVQSEMIKVAELRVPVEVGVKIGERWGEMK